MQRSILFLSRDVTRAENTLHRSERIAWKQRGSNAIVTSHLTLNFSNGRTRASKQGKSTSGVTTPWSHAEHSENWREYNFCVGGGLKIRFECVFIDGSIASRISSDNRCSFVSGIPVAVFRNNCRFTPRREVCALYNNRAAYTLSGLSRVSDSRAPFPLLSPIPVSRVVLITGREISSGERSERLILLRQRAPLRFHRFLF